MKRAVSYLILLFLLPVLVSVGFSQEQYLLMKPIGGAVETGNFENFKEICMEKISTKFEPPFEINGYMYKEKFIEDLNIKFSKFDTIRVEWASNQMGNNFAVQSLNLMLKNKRTEKNVFYKLIFFMVKKDKAWKIYYLRGLRI
jgi:hypothetical protein